MKRYYVLVEGRVQGVGFRNFCMVEAQKRNITGSVRNLSNGMVEIYAQGSEEDLNSFFMHIREGDRFIRVDDMTFKEKPILEDETGFRYGW